MQFSDILAIILTIIGGFGGAYLGTQASFFVEQNRRHRLIILDKPHEGKIDYSDDPCPRPAHIAKHLSIEIQNEEFATIWGKKVRRNTALQCHATITFHSLDGKMVTGRMPGRWCDTDQPVDMDILDVSGNRAGSVRDFNAPRRPSTVDIDPNEIFCLDIAARFDTDKCCYGWNNETYIYGWRNPLRRIPPGEYIVEVKARSGQVTAQTRFRLINGDGVFGLTKKEEDNFKRLHYETPKRPLPCISQLHSQPGFQDFLDIRED